MNKNRIRVQYSGFIVFSSQLLSVVTGLIFTLLLTRTMSTEQFGIWTNMFDYPVYFLIFSGILPFWATRFVARGKEGTVKTGTSVQLLIALVSTLVYLPVIVLISKGIGTQAYLLIYLISALYIFNTYMITVFESMLRSIRPQVIGYGLLIEETVKVAVALVVIVDLKQVFLGAILALVISAFVQILYYTRLVASELKKKVNWSYIKEWLKGSPAIVFNAFGGVLLSFVFILLFIYGGSEARAYYQAAFTFTSVISYSSSLAFALYPVLLAKTCPEEQVGESFKTVLMLAIPLATLTMVMSTSFLTILKSSFNVAWPVLIALTIDTLVVLIFNFYTSCLMGAEAFDEEGRISLRKLVKSKIFLVFGVTYIQGAIALPLIYYILTHTAVAGPVLATVYTISVLIGVHISSFIGLYSFRRGSFRIPVAWKSIGKYIAASLLMGTVLFLLPNTTTLTYTLGKAIAGFLLYVGLLVAIDVKARQLIKLIFAEIKGSWQQLTAKNGSIEPENVS
ncbi:MAG: oligosaccharide flippase family protein [Candidatus Bathyarchaeia archaeon]